MRKTIYIFLMVLIPLFLSATDWYVDALATPPGNGSQGSPFPEISDAVDALSDGDVVYVTAGTYLETVNFADHYFDLFGDNKLTTIIDGGNSSDGIIILASDPVITGLSNISGFTVMNCITSQEDDGAGFAIKNRNVTIEDCIVKQNVSDQHGGGISFGGDNGYTLTITDCTIENNSTDEHGGGIFFYGSGSDVLIMDNCTVDTNDCEGNGGGIFYYCTGSGELSMIECTIENNEADEDGGGIYCEGNGDQAVTISDCQISDNVSNNNTAHVGGGGIFCLDVEIDFDDLVIFGNTTDYNGGGIFVKTTEYENPEADFDNLLIYENHVGGHGGGICILNQGDADMVINQSSIVYNTGDGEYYGGVYVTNNAVDVINCIVYFNDGTEPGEPQYLQPVNTTTTYSCIGLSTVYNGTGNINTDPQFVDADGDDYNLDWNSPCMDAGDQSYDNDPDGTECDMGCFTARDHDNRGFVESETGDETYNWRGFPRLDFGAEENNGSFVDATDMLDKFGYPDHPDPVEVWYQYSGDPNLEGGWDDPVYEWDPDPCDDLIKSTRGFKIKVWGDAEDTALLRVFGDILDPDFEMTVDHEIDQNWFCYFLEETQNAQGAFDATTLNKLIRIDTYGWSAVKTGETWTWPQYPTLKYGELVVVYHDEGRDFTFEWQQPSRDIIEPYVRQEPTQFNYNEEPSYLPVYMVFGEEIPLEVAVYVDNVCKGAEVVDTDSLFHLRAYVLEEEPGYELEFVAYYGRSETRVMDYKLNGNFSQQNTNKLITGNLGEYAFIEFGEPLSDQVPELEVEMKIYPNPFNPTVIISFQVADYGTIDLEIYNAKGQKVKTLVRNQYCEFGDRIEKVWKGYNDQGQPVSGGVYFVRMQTAGDVQMKKVVLLK